MAPWRIVKKNAEAMGTDVEEETRHCFISFLCGAYFRTVTREKIREQKGIEVMYKTMQGPLFHVYVAGKGEGCGRPWAS